VLVALPRETRASGVWAHTPRLVLIAMLVWAGGGTIVSWIAQARGGAVLSAGALATIRTAILAMSAMTLAATSRFARSESASLAYPVLIAGAIKLVADDFLRSTPATLFAALAFYGAALLAVPRLLRARQTAEVADAAIVAGPPSIPVASVASGVQNPPVSL
jgi:hypothetical protein